MLMSVLMRMLVMMMHMLMPMRVVMLVRMVMIMMLVRVIVTMVMVRMLMRVVMIMMVMLMRMIVIMVVMLMFMRVIVIMVMVMVMVSVLMRMAMTMMMMRMLMRRRGIRQVRRQGCGPFGNVGIGRTYDDPQHVGLIRQVARPRAVADRFDDHRRQSARKVVHDRCDDACACRRRHFHRIGGRRDRQPAHHFQRGRSRNRINAVIAFDRARAERHRRAVDRLRLQGVERQRDADDIGDRINRPDFMEMHFFQRQAVDFAFRNGDFFEDRQTVCRHPFVEARAPDQLDDVGIMSMIRRRMCRIDDDIQLQGRDAFFVDALPAQLERLYADFAQLALNVVPVRSCVHERAQRHVTANPGEAIEIKNPHGSYSRLSRHLFVN